MTSISVKDRKHVSPQQDGMWYFVKTNDDDLCALCLLVDKDGNKYVTDFTRSEIAALFKGWQEANVKQDFLKGGVCGNG